MDYCRSLTIAVIGLSIIRPANAGEHEDVSVISTMDAGRAGFRVARPDVMVIQPTPTTIRRPGADPKVRAANIQMVSDFPRRPSSPGKQAETIPPHSFVAPPSPGQKTLQAPGVMAPGTLAPPAFLAPPSMNGSPPIDGQPGPNLDAIESPFVPPTADAEQHPMTNPPTLPPPSPEVGVESTIPPPTFPGEPPQALAAEPIPAEALEGVFGSGSVAGGTSLTALASMGTFSTPEVFGDSIGTGVLQFFPERPQPPPPLPRPPLPPRPPSPFEPARSAALVPSIRAIKISENQSPAPRNRLIYQFNYYDDVNGSVNDRFRSPISDVNVYRHIFGFEKTFFDGMTSVGMRLPLNTITANSPLRGVGQTETELGNLEIFGKYVLYSDPANGRLLSTGLAVSPSTGPSRFAGASYLEPLNSTTIQPFVGGIYRAGRLFVQGFFSLDIPFNSNNVTMLYNDYAFGYFLYESANPDQFLSSIVPIFEVHVNTPLNHRGVRLDDPAGTPDFVNLTYGTSFQFGRRARLLGAIVTPVTGPRPFDLEVIAALNVYY
ncbi:hypothetical protein [Tautonia plasticadhaerens]|uniref:Uncharacterized protein n=1 Tax=Tautonia plasticadhaerens TaxID=2527974 RepID=A0A518H8K3_9BACT|nr:hypothetical protein [Tautonia plasticadhaerens]QDV37164.1 hypothetical protein ElP_50970 [Tautonia plasticadhaerens]